MGLKWKESTSYKLHFKTFPADQMLSQILKSWQEKQEKEDNKLPFVNTSVIV